MHKVPMLEQTQAATFAEDSGRSWESDWQFLLIDVVPDLGECRKQVAPKIKCLPTRPAHNESIPTIPTTPSHYTSLPLKNVKQKLSPQDRASVRDKASLKVVFQ